MKTQRTALLALLLSTLLAACGGGRGSGGDDPAEPTPSPATPPAPSVTPGDGTIDASWVAVDGATSYKVHFATGGDGSDAQAGDETTALSYAIQGLEGGRTYFVWLEAINEGGSSVGPAVPCTPAAPVVPTKPAPPPAPAVRAGEGTISVTWETVPGAKSYRVHHNIADDRSGGEVSSAVTEQLYVIRGLKNDQPYFVWLEAVNEEGSSTGPTASCTPTPDSPPETPPAPHVTPGDEKLTVTWPPVEHATSYVVHYGVDAALSRAQAGEETTERSYVIPNLEDGKGNYVWLEARNSMGASMSASALGTPTTGLPPLTLAASADTQHRKGYGYLNGAYDTPDNFTLEAGGWFLYDDDNPVRASSSFEIEFDLSKLPSRHIKSVTFRLFYEGLAGDLDPFFSGTGDPEGYWENMGWFTLSAGGESFHFFEPAAKNDYIETSGFLPATIAATRSTDPTLVIQGRFPGDGRDPGEPAFGPQNRKGYANFAGSGDWQHAPELVITFE